MGVPGQALTILSSYGGAASMRIHANAWEAPGDMHVVTF